MRRAAPALALFAACAAPPVPPGPAPAQTPAPPPPQGPAAAWTLRHRKGDVQTFRTRTALSGQQGDSPIAASTLSLFRSEVRAVDARGMATVVTAMLSTRTRLNGRELPPTDRALPTATLKIDRRGRALDYRTTAPDSPLTRLESILANAPVPPAPVRPSTSWDSTLDNRLAGAGKVTLRSTYRGLETYGGRDAYKVEVGMAVPRADPPKPDNTVDVTGEYYVDARRGRLLGGRYTLARVFLPSPGGDLRVAVRIETEAQDAPPPDPKAK